MLRLLYLILPKALNWLANNPDAWKRAVEAVEATYGALRKGTITKEKRAEYFAGWMEGITDTAKNPTRVLNFLREAALVYVDWKNQSK